MRALAAGSHLEPHCLAAAFGLCSLMRVGHSSDPRKVPTSSHVLGAQLPALQEPDSSWGDRQKLKTIQSDVFFQRYIESTRKQRIERLPSPTPHKLRLKTFGNRPLLLR